MKAGNIIAAGNIVIGTTTIEATIPVGGIVTVGGVITGMITKAMNATDAGLGLDGGGLGPATRPGDWPGNSTQLHR